MKISSAPGRMVLGWLLAAVTLLGLATTLRADGPATLPTALVYKDPKAPLEDRVNDLLARLTPSEKLDIMGGGGFNTKAILRLGVPIMRMSDGPLGIGYVGCTVLCGGPALAATWDPAMAVNMGKIQGTEVQNRREGEQVILGPGINIHRSPLGGRNGEYFSEDPYLAGVIAAGYVQGVQSTGAAACVKHYACNNQESGRWNIDETVSERANGEIYLPAFQAAVQQGHAWAIMTAYNQVNGSYCSANDFLNNQVLKKEWGFDGCEMSDWGAVHDTKLAVLGGQDLEMPTGGHFNNGALSPLVANGTVSQAVIDDHVRRILRLIIRTGMVDGVSKAPDKSNKWEPADRAMDREAAGKSAILLKNNAAAGDIAAAPVLPLNAKTIKSLAVIGPIAQKMPTSPYGSGHVNFAYTLSPLDALKAKVGAGVTVGYTDGYKLEGTASALATIDMSVFKAPDGTAGGLLAEYFKGKNLEGKSLATRVENRITIAPPPGIGPNDFSIRWTGAMTVADTGEYVFGLSSDDGSRLMIDDKTIVDSWSDHDKNYFVSGKVTLTAGKTYKVRVEYYQAGGEFNINLLWGKPGQVPVDPQITAAVDLAKKSDAVIICAGLTDKFEGEEHDRGGFNLPGNEDDLISAVAAANPKTIVVLFGGSVCRLTDWIDSVPSVFQVYYPGQEGASALADLIFGDINPSGRLPDTIGRARSDYNDAGLFPGNPVYVDDIYVGYRWFDKKNIEPLFPFGHGLSYTSYKYSNLKITPLVLSGGGATAPAADTMPARGIVSVAVDVENAGKMAGEEVVQLYMHAMEPKVDRPVKELKGFTRVALNAGEKKTATLMIDPRALAYWDDAGKQWKADAGDYEIQIGASSRDIRQSARIKLAATWTAKETAPTK